MNFKTKCKTEKIAIAEARELAIESAETNQCDWTEKVLLMSGDTLYFNAHVSGLVTKCKVSGWDTEGHVFCGPKAHAIAE